MQLTYHERKRMEPYSYQVLPAAGYAFDEWFTCRFIAIKVEGGNFPLRIGELIVLSRIPQEKRTEKACTYDFVLKQT